MLDNLNSAAASLGLPIAQGFWDENKTGSKPESYLVWYFLNDNFDLEADDEIEEESVELGLSYYSKQGADSISLKSLRDAFEPQGFDVLPGGFSAYERDTGYYHREYRLIFYN